MPSNPLHFPQHEEDKMNRTDDRNGMSRMSAIAFNLVGALVMALAFAAGVQAAEAPTTGRNFDHTRTGFPLTGAHSRAECGECHARGIFKGTPRECVSCHTSGSARATTSKPANHVQTTAPCSQCHKSTLTWAGAKYDHSAIAPGTCATCHNGSRATGKPANHVQTTASCDQCHRTSGWLPAGFNHSGIAPGTCTSCHNGTRATGKPNNATHQDVTASCDQCHSTTTWLGAKFNHTGITPGTCATCHNGTRATGKPNDAAHQNTASCDQCHNTTTFFGAKFNHTAAGVTPGTCATCHGTGGGAKTKVPVPHYAGSCDNCHNTTTFLGAKFDHAAVTPGTCATCHGTGGTAKTKVPVPHFSGSCDLCHTTTAFIPNKSYTHISAFYRPHNAGVTCYQCHTSRTNVANWPSSTYKPDCAGCHATRYKAGSHKKYGSVLYTVSELRNCAGSCHEYTDSTLTTILKTRSSKHRSTDGGF